jgi:hypothetical protein
MDVFCDSVATSLSIAWRSMKYSCNFFGIVLLVFFVPARYMVVKIEFLFRDGLAKYEEL